MSKASKKTPVAKNRKKNSPAGAVGESRAPAKAVSDLQELKNMVAGNEKHSFRSWNHVRKILTSGDASSNNVFLGNGFNIAIGAKTDYKELGQALLEHATVNEFLTENASRLLNKMKKKPEQIELLINTGLGKRPCKRFIKEIFYRKILDRCSASNRKEILDFLALFNKFFTTNYDPLLYLFLLKIKEDESDDKKSIYSRKVKQIDGGAVTIPKKGSLKKVSVPLKAMTKTLRYELSKYIIPENESAGEGRDGFFKALDRKISHKLKIDDGFRPPKNTKEVSYMQWRTHPKPKGGYQENMFYLHGGLFIYKKRGEVRKTVSDNKVSFVEYLRSRSHLSLLCVFEAYGRDKEAKIKKSAYLRNCLTALRKAKGNLCIVGWRCHENDRHLAKRINSNPLIDTLLVSYYRKDKEKTVTNYTKAFPDKKIIFWNISEAPFNSTKIKKEEEEKRKQQAEKQNR